MLRYCGFIEHKPDDTEFIESQILDISMGGLLFKTDVRISLGQNTWLNFVLTELLHALPDAHESTGDAKLMMDIVGEVRQCEEHHESGFIVGVKFEKIVAGDLEPLRSIIEIYG